MGATADECTLPSTANMSSRVVQLVPQRKTSQESTAKKESPFASFPITHNGDESERCIYLCYVVSRYLRFLFHFMVKLS